MDDSWRIWTSAGSAGTLDAADLAKVRLFDSVVQLGAALIPPPPVAAGVAPAQASGQPGLAEPPAPDPGHEESAGEQIVAPTESVVVRYNVTAVDGLFLIVPPFRYGLKLRFRGQVSARLVQVNVETGLETSLVHFSSDSLPGFHVLEATATEDSPLLDFINNVYYVEATLTASSIVVGKPAAISILQVRAVPTFPG